MKTKILSIFLSVVAMLGLASCSDDNWNSGNAGASEGSLSLGSLNVDVDIDESLVSRAQVSTDAFIVDLINRSTGAVQRSYTYGSMPEVISLPVGDYTVSVRSHNVIAADWEAPYYAGQEDFSIEVGKITEIGTVVCKFSNIKVTVRFTKELISSVGSDAKVTVIANDRGSLDYALSETRPGYFAAIEGSSTLVAEFNGTVEGNAVHAIKTFTDVEAGQHHIITFSVKNGNSQLPDEHGTIDAGGITVDADIAHESLSGDAPTADENQQGSNRRPGDEEWPDEPTPPGPGPDDPTPPGPVTEPITIAPNSDCPGLDLNGGENEVVDGDPYIVDIHADSGITKLNVTIQSTNNDFLASAGEFVPLDFDMCNLSDSEYEGLASIGLEGNDAVRNKTDVPFDISGLVPLLAAFPGQHSFIITVNDAAGNSLTKKLIFKV